MNARRAPPIAGRRAPPIAGRRAAPIAGRRAALIAGRRAALIAAGVAGAAGLSPGEARAEPPVALRFDYEAHEGCPSAAEFERDVLARTSRARGAVEGEPALEVWVRIASKDGSQGRIVLWKSSTPRAREVSGATCGEVAEALALITALAVDPSAGAGKAPPSTPVANTPVTNTPVTNTPVTNTPVVPPPSAPWSMTVSTEWVPPPWRGPVPAPSPVKAWSAGALVGAALAGAPYPLFGGGLFVERASGGASVGSGGVAARLSADLGATGTFDAGPGAASFLRGTLGLEGCPFARVAVWLTAGGCVAGEVGFLVGQGVARAEIAAVDGALVPWASLGLRARLTADVGTSWILTLDGGPAFPLVRRSFVFEAPDFTVFEVPPVTGSLRLSAGVRF